MLYPTLAISAGVTCIFITWVLQTSHGERISINRSKVAQWHLLIISAITLFIGLSLVIYYYPHINFGSTLTPQGEPISPSVASGSSGNPSIFLSVLGIIITLATVIVIEVSKNAVENIRYEREVILEKILDEKNIVLERCKWIEDQYNERNNEANLLFLTALRMHLIHENENEIKMAHQNNETDLSRFREPLSDFYEATSPESQAEYLVYIRREFKRQGGCPLLKIERDYIKKLREYYTASPKHVDKLGDLATLAQEALEHIEQQ